MKGDVILLVEDNPDDVKLTLRSFVRNNLANEVVVARDGSEALDYLFGLGAYAGRDVTNQPCLVLLDLKLPRVSGLEVLQRVRGDARTELIPIIVLTSSWEEQDMMQSYSSGANIYIRKPVHFTQFLNSARFLGLDWTLLESGLAILHREKPAAAVARSEEPDAGPSPTPSAQGSQAGAERPVEVIVGISEEPLGGLVSTILRVDGLHVRQGHDARDVFRLLFSSLPDFVILDSRLPDIQGVDVLRAMRGSEAGRAVVTYLLTEDLERTRRDVPDLDVRLVQKPLDILRLAESIHDVLERREDPTRRKARLLGAPVEAEVSDAGPAARLARATSAWALIGVSPDAPLEVVTDAADGLIRQLTELALHEKSVELRSRAAATAARVRAARTALIDHHARNTTP